MGGRAPHLGHRDGAGQRADLFYYSDIAQKASDVFTVELFGTCPQTTTTLAVLGETSAVKAAMEAIEAGQSAGF